MSGIALPLGLLISGALGFGLGAEPSLLLRTVRGRTGAGNGSAAQDFIDYLYPLAVAFFAGFVFSTLVPDALSHSKGSLITFIAGISVMGLLSRFVFKRDPCCETGHDHRGFGVMSLAAMAVCSLNDGLLIGLLDPSWLSGLNLGMLVHKISSSFAIVQVLKRTGFQGKGLAAFGVVYTLISPCAYLVAGASLIRNLPDPELLLAFSAGLLAYVTLVNLVPHARAIIQRRPRTAYAFAIAFLLSITLGFWHTALHHKMDEAGTVVDIDPAPAASTVPSAPVTR
jgi:zinc transporter ZupT